MSYAPGHLHIAKPALQHDDVGYDLEVDYAPVGADMHFKVHGEINGKAFSDEFTLAKDLAFDFASKLFHICEKHGLPHTADISKLGGHYDEMFEDIRAKLHVHSGDPVSPEHLDRI